MQISRGRHPKKAASETPATVTVPEATGPDTVVSSPPIVPSVTNAQIIKRTREKKIQQGGKQARSLKELKDFLGGFTDEASSLKAFAETFIKFIQGAYTDTTMERKLKGFIVSVPEPEIAGLEATLVPEVPSVVETPVETTEATVTAILETEPLPVETEATVPEIVPFPVETVETPFPVVEAA